jgi:hypothetical protein
MAHFRFTVVVMAALSAALLAACGTGGNSRRADGYSGSTDSDWYEYRQDEVGCAGEAQRSGVSPGETFDNYVNNCVIDRETERNRQQQ